ncbi:MAG: hypothetical protein COB02_12285 [Candidatus Cloacimonadota bacterium]|nr:MAG: hypothetical protein COB02_12285 [Candidatus Cloacimonadota bacterium]
MNISNVLTWRKFLRTYLKNNEHYSSEEIYGLTSNIGYKCQYLEYLNTVVYNNNHFSIQTVHNQYYILTIIIIIEAIFDYIIKDKDLHIKKGFTPIDKLKGCEFKGGSISQELFQNNLKFFKILHPKTSDLKPTENYKVNLEVFIKNKKPEQIFSTKLIDMISIIQNKTTLFPDSILVEVNSLRELRNRIHLKADILDFNTFDEISLVNSAKKTLNEIFKHLFNTDEFDYLINFLNVNNHQN